MRATDLLGLTVITRDGTSLGVVHDLHLAERGAPIGDSGSPAYRIIALECGPIGLAHRLGYGHRDLAGPWPLHRWLGRLTRHSQRISWDDIGSIDEDGITLRVDHDAVSRRRADQA